MAVAAYKISADTILSKQEKCWTMLYTTIQICKAIAIYFKANKFNYTLLKNYNTNNEELTRKANHYSSQMFAIFCTCFVIFNFILIQPLFFANYSVWIFLQIWLKLEMRHRSPFMYKKVHSFLLSEKLLLEKTPLKPLLSEKKLLH